MTVKTDEDKNTAPAVRRPRSKHAGWKSGLMVAGLGAVVVGAGYLAGANAPAAGVSAQGSNAQVIDSQPTAIERQQGAVRADPEASVQAFSERVRAGDDESGSYGEYSEEGAHEGSDEGAVFQAQPRQPRRLRSNSPSQGQLGTQQPQFRAPVTRSRGS